MANLVICCDGTWNTPDQLDKGVPAPTNVVRLYNAVGEVDALGVSQSTYYHPGVGTNGGWWDKAVGGGTGAGLDNNIMSAYQKLCYWYKPGDAIYLFGFSRGAYTVRSLSGFINCCGLLKISELQPNEVWSRIKALLTGGYRRKTEQRADWDQQGWKFLNGANEQIPIHFVGVWDTVGALGIPDDMALLNLVDFRERYTFHDTSLHPSVKYARHALAMDERRASFQPTLWSQPPDGADLKQIWFPGVHSDVGGGYQDCGLANGALLWMIDEARMAGLCFNSDILRQIKPDVYDTMHDSCDGVFSILATQPRSVPNLIKQPNLFHSSALTRQKVPPITQCPYRKIRSLEPSTPLLIDISARLTWNETGLWVEAGTTYIFSTSGEWLDDSIVCNAAGPINDQIQISELGYMIGSALGKMETWYGKIFKNSEASFNFTRRHEMYPWFSLIGAITNSDGVDAKGILLKAETFLIGTGCRYTPKRSGYLYAYANDAWNCYGNNRGHIALEIQQPKINQNKN